MIEGGSKGFIEFCLLYFLEAYNVRSELVDFIEEEIEPFTPAKAPSHTFTAIRAKEWGF